MPCDRLTTRMTLVTLSLVVISVASGLKWILFRRRRGLRLLTHGGPSITTVNRRLVSVSN